MTLAEKLRFLANRAEDGKEFSIGREDDIYRFRNSELRYVGQERTYDYSPLSLKNILSLPIKLKPQWEFTENEIYFSIKDINQKETMVSISEVYRALRNIEILLGRDVKGE